MDIPKTELFAILQEFNPWWSGQPIQDLPSWERTAFQEIWRWVEDRESRRMLLLTGARQVGKTTIFRQIIRKQLQAGFPASNILYVTFDHTILKLAGIEQTITAWESAYPVDNDYPRMLYIDEIQYIDGWQTWIKHQVDFHRKNRIAATGSASPLRDGVAESGLGRIETIPLPTLSFKEYLQLRKISTPELINIRSLRELFDWGEVDFIRTAHVARPLTAHFHEYIIRGGFPEPALQNEIARCQRLLREDIVDKALKRDMTAFYNVRRVLEIERLFLYLCYHDGGIFDVAKVTTELQGVNKQTVINFIDLFEATHLVYRLRPYGYGKEILRGRDKLYLADAALPGAVTLQGRKLLERPDRLGSAVETAFFKHVYTRFYNNTPRFSYWKSAKGDEVDLIAETTDRSVPFEVKYQDTAMTQNKVTGLRLFSEKYKIDQSYIISQRWEDFRVMQLNSAIKGNEHKEIDSKALVIPAPIACYWLS
jgi:predicted AAA+ superfamily ATPase